MIDRLARDRLAELIRHVVSGQMSLDAFWAEAEEFEESTVDSAVLAVCGAVWALHPDAHLYFAKLRGRYRSTPAVRRRLAIAALFLYTNYEYEWPQIWREVPGDCWLLLICAAFIIAGLGLIIPTRLVSPWWGIEAGICFLDALLIFAFSHWRAARSHARWIAAQRRMATHGSWPFRRRSQFREARRRSHLLAGRAAS
jgi:hypothetical protein